MEEWQKVTSPVATNHLKGLLALESERRKGENEVLMAPVSPGNCHHCGKSIVTIPFYQCIFHKEGLFCEDCATMRGNKSISDVNVDGLEKAPSCLPWNMRKGKHWKDCIWERRSS